MAQHYDLIVRNGTVVDGTGAEPYAADVAITDGRIAAIAPDLSGTATREIDAAGKLVTPGFVDIHTHYDAQAVWDSHLAPSSLHGVTTVVMGNCGVGFAPCRPQDREKMIELMEGVEDIPGAVMHEGLEWSWETFPEYLDAIAARPRDVDVCALVPHAALRVYVMGDRAVAFEPANDDDIAQMRALTAEAVKAGAFGVSTSRALFHKTVAGAYIPTMRAPVDEFVGIANGLKDAGSGFIEAITDWITDPRRDPQNAPSDPAGAFDVLKRVARESGRPLVYSMVQINSQPNLYADVLAMNRKANAEEGVNIRPVFPPRAVGFLLGLQATQTPFSGCPTFKALNHLPLAEKVAKLRDPAIRARILAEDPVKESTFTLIHLLSYKWMFPFRDKDYQPKAHESAAAVAAREGRTPQEVVYDWLLENDGRNFVYMPAANYVGHSFSASEEMLGDDMAIMGLGDGGAHVGFILDAGFPTWLLTHWGKAEGKFPMPELVRRLTSDTADAAGLGDRGR
ncbi:MAG: amidohydrolase family protein, partial [Alphaproteobacteria bacterium]|nr:amidohydrolase family protein [Alphaproteobacteria bacterium]